MLSTQFLGDPSKRIADMAYLHPKAIGQFIKLQDHLVLQKSQGKAPVLFLPFETYRTPARQKWLIDHTNSTKANPWQSAHQYGLAVDYVPWIDQKWTWEADDGVWKYLAQEAQSFGLKVPYSWDKVHVEHPFFARVRAVLFTS